MGELAVDQRAATSPSASSTLPLELVHGGRVRVTGTAPDGLRWAAAGWAA